MTRDDPMLRLACEIHRRLGHRNVCQRDEFVAAASYFQDAQGAVGLAWRRIQKAVRHGWLLAAQALRTEMMTAARSLEAQTRGFIAAQDAQDAQTAREPGPPALRFILEELKQLQDEFEEVELQPDKGLVIARTDRIVLEEVDLGPFAIELHVERLGTRVDPGC